MDKRKALQILADHGYKITKRREDILDFFLHEEKYYPAKSLYEHIQLKDPGISHDTVYRNLHLFHDLNILESTNLHDEKHFRIQCSDMHHHHFICEACGITKKLKICPMDEVKSMLQDYHIDDHKFEVYGKCPDCA
ncbi:MAG TPA: Fur family transcriptional regulator [Pseudogracilibacillus sp.]|nr:Fur family transcriptional regulator [Pseudogracilibacillus sp.]